MTDQQWRAISPAESALVAAILLGSNVPDCVNMAKDIDSARVSTEPGWVLDVDNPGSELRSSMPDGPFPGRVFVPNSVEYQGEIIIWITDGKISGLEYAWITGEPPSRWPRPDEIQIVNE
jgi:hypothetical protein